MNRLYCMVLSILIIFSGVDIAIAKETKGGSKCEVCPTCRTCPTCTTCPTCPTCPTPTLSYTLLSSPCQPTDTITQCENRQDGELAMLRIECSAAGSCSSQTTAMIAKVSNAAWRHYTGGTSIGGAQLEAMCFLQCGSGSTVVSVTEGAWVEATS